MPRDAVIEVLKAPAEVGELTRSSRSRVRGRRRPVDRAAVLAAEVDQSGVGQGRKEGPQNEIDELVGCAGIVAPFQ